jgi:hypothetical protein
LKSESRPINTSRSLFFYELNLFSLRHDLMCVHSACRRPTMKQDCTRAAMEIQAILECSFTAQDSKGTELMGISPPRRSPNPMCRNKGFDVSCAEALCSSAALEQALTSLSNVSNYCTWPQSPCGVPIACASTCGPLATQPPSSIGSLGGGSCSSSPIDRMSWSRI